MCGETFNLYDLGLHRNVLAKGSQLPCACGEGSAAGSSSLVAAEDQGVFRIRTMGFEVVKDPASGEHAAGRDDDH